MAIAVAVGVTLFTREPAKETSLARDAKLIDVICTKCSQHRQISSEEYQLAMNAIPRDRQQSRAGVGRRNENAVGLEIDCSACAAPTGRLASHCSKHDTYFVKYTETGANAVCPQCRQR